MIKQIIQYLPSTCVCTAVLVLSVINVGVLPQVDAPNSDKIVHAVMYFGIVVSLLLDSTRYLTLFASKNKIVFALVFAIAFGALMEGIQAMLPWRSASLYDIVANSLGACLGLSVFLLLNKFCRKS